MIDRALLVNLLGLRYRLLWAAARTRNGRVALFVVGYLAAMLIGAFLFLGGLAAATAAIGSGQSELVLRTAFGVLFVFALISFIVLGVGVNSALSEDSLRRFPISKWERFAARHVAAELDAFWLLLLALYVGLALGAGTFGGSAWLTVPAALLLLSANYLVAAIVVAFVDIIMRTRAGRTTLALVTLLCICFAPPLLIHGVRGWSALSLVAMAAARLTPPFMAAAVFGSFGMRSVAHAVGLLAWVGLLTVVLAAVERWRPVPQRAIGAAAGWDTAHDRVARLFGPELAPLAGKLLRYCTRSPQVRIVAITALPSFVLLALIGRRSSMTFSQALAGMAFFAGNAAGPLALNLFGFDGSGFRRYLLLPIAPSRILFAASAIVMVPGAVFVLPALALWTVVSPTYTDPYSLAMLAGAGLTGWLLFPTLGVWTSVLAPTAIEFDRTLGNKLSLAANAVMVGSILVFFGIQVVLLKLHIDDQALVRHWWVTVVMIPAAAVAYAATLLVGGRVMSARRERMLDAIDGV